jgi:predicted nucleic acid-binding protein
MRVVYDTSVLVTILSRRELILRLQSDMSRGAVVLVTSPFILDELDRVLSNKFGLTKQGAKNRVRLLNRVAEVVRPNDVQRVACDANDWSQGSDP